MRWWRGNYITFYKCNWIGSIMQKAAILAAGEGLRIKSITPFKPIVKINGTALLELTLKNINYKDFETIIIIFNSEEKEMDFSLLPSLVTPSVSYFFKSTPSSMHSLFEIAERLKIKKGEHLFVSMVDSIVKPSEIKKFQDFCRHLQNDESALLVTPFIDDEKPLTLKIDCDGYISHFQCPIEEGVLVTSGVYVFSQNVFPLLKELLFEGHSKMRNFLTELLKRNHKIKAFKVNKTIDIDRPQDIKAAEDFLKECE